MKTTILIADDHPLLRQSLRSILEAEASFDVVGEADSADQALSMARSLAPDIVLMQVGLQGMSGVEATKRILTASPATRVVGISTHSDRHYVLGMLEAGALAYVIKDSAWEDLRDAVHAVSRGDLYVSPEVASIVSF